MSCDYGVPISVQWPNVYNAVAACNPLTALLYIACDYDRLMPTINRCTEIKFLTSMTEGASKVMYYHTNTKLYRWHQTLNFVGVQLGDEAVDRVRAPLNFCWQKLFWVLIVYLARIMYLNTVLKPCEYKGAVTFLCIHCILLMGLWKHFRLIRVFVFLNRVCIYNKVQL